MAVSSKKTGKMTAQDYWNAAWRGLSPGGLQQNPPEYTDIGPDPETVDMPDDPYVLPDNPVELQTAAVPIPVVLVDDLSHTVKRVEKYNICLTANVDANTSRILIPRDPFRTQVIVQNLGPGIVYLGHNESVGSSGFSLPLNQLIVLGTTREVWAIQQSAQASIAQVSVLMEYDKDTA